MANMALLLIFSLSESDMAPLSRPICPPYFKRYSNIRKNPPEFSSYEKKDMHRYSNNSD